MVGSFVRQRSPCEPHRCHRRSRQHAGGGPQARIGTLSSAPCSRSHALGTFPGFLPRERPRWVAVRRGWCFRAKGQCTSVLIAKWPQRCVARRCPGRADPPTEPLMWKTPLESGFLRIGGRERRLGFLRQQQLRKIPLITRPPTHATPSADAHNLGESRTTHTRRRSRGGLNCSPLAKCLVSHRAFWLRPTARHRNRRGR